MAIPSNNNVYSKLTTGIDAVVTTITLVDASTFPNAGFIVVGGGVDTLINEVIEYTGKTGNQLTGCVRGSDNSTAESHTANAYVGISIINKHLEEIWDVIDENDEISQAQCVYATNTVLTGLIETDSYTPVTGDRVLLVGQTNLTENGVWEVSTSSWTRPTDYNTGENVGGKVVFITDGLNGVGSGWTCDNVKPNDVVGTHNLTFTQFAIGDRGTTMISSAEVVNLDMLFNTAKMQNFAVPKRNSTTARLIGYDIWETSTKTTKLFEQTRVFGTDESQIDYDRLITKVTTDILAGRKMTETRTYEEITLPSSEKVIVMKDKTKVISDV